MIEIKQFEQSEQFVVHRSSDEKVKDFRLVHVWFCDLDDDSQFEQNMPVAPSEQIRFARLKNSLERKRLVNRFSFVRTVIGNLAGVLPNNLNFYSDARGKPLLMCLVSKSGTLTRLHFNISHTENIMALAVFDQDVGIDIEIVKYDLDFFDIAKAQFDQESFEWLCTQHGKQVAVEFYRLWTRKEALLKKDGTGITIKSCPKLIENISSISSLKFCVGKKEIIGTLAF